MWYQAHTRVPSLEELQACFRLRSPRQNSSSYFPYNIGGRLLKKDYKKKRWASRWFFLRGTWEQSASEGAQLANYMPRELCKPRWSGNFVTPLREVMRDVEAAFRLKEDPRPSDFIMEEALRTCGLAQAGGP